MTAHRIAWGPRFVPRTNEGPMGCTCGAEMSSDAFANHRRELGLPTRGFSNMGTTERDQPSPWRRQARGTWLRRAAA